MKKKFIVSLLLAVFIVSGLMAATSTFLQATAGSDKIPMKPVLGSDPFTRLNYHTIKNRWEELGSNAPYKNLETVDSGYYNNKGIIAIGGIKDIQKNSFSSNITIKLMASCSKGFYFISQSSPYYRRPFELYVVPRITAYRTPLFQTYEAYYYLEPIVIKEGSTIIEFDFTKSDNWPQVKGSSKSKDADSIDIFFDLVMVLPGTVDENHNLIDESNRIFPLTKADDYSSLVDLTMQVQVDGSNFDVSKGLSVPSTGYYNTPKPEESKNSLSLYIYPSALSGSINMKAYNERQAIADVEVLGINKLSNADDFKNKYEGGFLDWLLGDLITAIYGEAEKTSYAVFMSSIPDPFKKGPHFKMVKDTLEGSVDTPQTKYNSIPYTVVLVNQASGALEEKTYTGEEYYDLSQPKPSITKDADNNIIDTTKNKEYSHLFIPKGVEMRATNSTQNNVLTFPFKGTAYLVLDDNSSVVMEAGRYVSQVYVHVVNLQ